MMSEGGLTFEDGISAAGRYVEMRAEMDLVICLSCCPQDITSICGNKPHNAHFEIY